MGKSKKPTKKQLSDAGRKLSDSKSSPSTKSKAGRTLGKG